MIRKPWTFFIQSSFLQKARLIQILLLVLYARIIVDFVPLKLYYKYYFLSKNNRFINLQPFTSEIGLIKKVFKFIPWNVTCLMECIVVKEYLKKYKVEVPIYLGINISNGIKAHAWHQTITPKGFAKLNLEKHF